MQNNIENILDENRLIPVVSISNEDEVHEIYNKLQSKGINCVEITLRTDFSWKAIELFKKHYGSEFIVGVGTVISKHHIHNSVEAGVDFIVSPGLTDSMMKYLEFSQIPFLPGVSTPSEIMKGLEMGWEIFKFFPAEIAGGIPALKTYSSVFKKATFCPTGGINESNYKDYLALSNVRCVGGSWITK